MYEEIKQMLGRSTDNLKLIEGSRYRCEKMDINRKMKCLPAVSSGDVERSKKHVTGHIRMMRRSTPEYYGNVTAALAANHSVLLYIYSNQDIFGRYGNQALKDELAEINLKLGANLSESVVGTCANELAQRSQNGVWVVGDEHYVEALTPYACYAFPIHGKYQRSGEIMLITRAENVTPELVSLFYLIESTEQVITTGRVTENIAIADVMMQNELSKNGGDDIVIVIDPEEYITYANDGFYAAYGVTPKDIINEKISNVVPEVTPLLLNARYGIGMKDQLVELQIRSGKKQACRISTSIIKSGESPFGTVITAVLDGPKNRKTKDENSSVYRFSDLIGISSKFVKLKEFAERVAVTDAPVLVQGESGTGKELFAHAIHAASRRADNPFVVVNCAAIPKDLIGSELFGYVGGAFTGASKNGAKGKFEVANNGTLFLDEIGDMPLEMQSVLLRAVESNEIFRVGGSKPIPINVRLITATNRDLWQMVQEQTFRKDLYYRINVVNLNMIPLREKKEDIPALVESFVRTYSARNNVHIRGIDPEVIQLLLNYDWPGNVRELKNVIQRCVSIADDYIVKELLPPEILNINPVPQKRVQSEEVEESESYKERMMRQKREEALLILQECKGNKSLAAEKMGISRSTFYRMIK